MHVLSASSGVMTKERIFIHIDADAFFASVEQMLHRELQNKAIVTGRDGSIAVALSYEAKALGVKRATPIHEIRKEFPSVQMVASDYYMYRIFSDRMLQIIREFIPRVRRKSIDECAAEITGQASSLSEAFSLATDIKDSLETRLGCQFSFGISSSPLLAKMASGMNKPSGLTVLDTEENTDYHALHVKEVSGLGRKLCERLNGLGIIRIGEFINQYHRIKRNFSIVQDDIYTQIQGYAPIRERIEKPQQSMNRARSFKVTDNPNEVFGQLVLNFEHLMRKLRAQNLVVGSVYLSMRTAIRKPIGAHMRLDKKSRDSHFLLMHFRMMFDELWVSGEAYRYVSVTFGGLRYRHVIQSDIFGSFIDEQENESVAKAIDQLDAKFGKACVSLASTLMTPRKLGSHIRPSEYPITMPHALLPGESLYRRLNYPFLGTI